ncbi:hypothetical protein NPIL_667221 [Nephila pilipes]|uniref:Uncharacterized protein n=1 Tax=Nephila pilipes TaxID=299642 RepID=A0A8X6NS32_NEPPI|nr:hypothetical protein NPIL_667221 [Nephila pilipes]
MQQASSIYKRGMNKKRYLLKQVSPSQQIPGEINGIPFHLQLGKKEQQTTPAKKINRMQKTNQGGGKRVSCSQGFIYRDLSTRITRKVARVNLKLPCEIEGMHTMIIDQSVPEAAVFFLTPRRQTENYLLFRESSIWCRLHYVPAPRREIPYFVSLLNQPHPQQMEREEVGKKKGGEESTSPSKKNRSF